MILTRKTLEKIGDMVGLQRPRRRHRRPKHPDRAFIITKSTYKVYAYLGLDRYYMSRILIIPDTGASPNFVRKADLPDELHNHIRHGHRTDIYDANTKPVPMTGTVKMSVNLESFLAHVEFIMCQSLAAAVILGADF